MEKIKMVDLGAQFADTYSGMITPPEQILETGQYIGGPHVGEFEEAWASYCGVAQAIGVSSGTDALTAAYEALIARWGGSRIRVVTQANTFVATATAALRCREDVTVHFIDCDEYFGMSPASLQEVLTGDAGDYDLTIVVPVHMYGIMCDMTSLTQIVNAHENVFMVEDASHAHGSRDVFGKRAGSYSDLAAFSLFPAKPLGAAGDAGVVVTDQDTYAYAAWVRSYINCGRGDSWDVHDKVGFTYRLDTLQAVILRAKLRKLDDWRRGRQAVANRYFTEWRDIDEIRLPLPRATCTECAWYAFPLRIEKAKREKLQSHLFEKDIPFKRYYYPLVPCSRWVDGEPAARVVAHLDNAAEFAEQILCVPIHEFLVEEQQEYIIREVREGLAGG